MQTLRQALQDQDPGFLRAIGELWGIDLPGREQGQAIETLLALMLEPAEAEEIITALPHASQQALRRLLAEGGRLPAGDFSQAFGEIRSMGPGRRDREKPWRSPASASERLYYHGLISLAFADSPAGPKEFTFIPVDLRPILRQLLGAPTRSQNAQLVTTAPPELQAASSGILDDATTLLAALRRRPYTGSTLPPDALQRLHPYLILPAAVEMMTHLLLEEGILTKDPFTPVPTEAASALEAPRNQALKQLALSWQRSETWHDLALLDHLEPAGGQWPQDPRTIRSATLALVEPLERDQWLWLDEFVDSIKRKYPTFARPGGDFNSWLLRDRRTGSFVQGWASWDTVDGALLRRLITGPLHWLGGVDLGFDQPESNRPTHFKLTPWIEVFFKPDWLGELVEPTAAAEIKPDGQLILPRAVPRWLRYQIARLCTWESLTDDLYHYRLRPSAVLAAADQGLRRQHIERLLNELSDAPIPPSLMAAVQRLLDQGIEASARDLIVLQLKNAALLDQLMKEKITSRWIKERLGPSSAVVSREALPMLLEAAARSGLLIEPPSGEG